MTEENWVGFQANGLLIDVARARCKHLYAEEFEHDRKVNKVPCVDCF